MSSINVNGYKIVVSNNKVTINDVVYDKPGFGSTLSMINGVIYVNGYRFVDGKWVKSGFWGWLTSLFQ